MNTIRKLATIRRIDEIKEIPNASSIECAVVGGWTVVVKKGEYQVGALVVMCEIDSWIPTELAPFLTKSVEPREYNGIKGERLRTVKLRGQLSQGLLLPLEPTCANIESELFEGLDVSVPLNIQKWEAPIPAQLAGQVRGNFPTLVPKTDQERVQNLVKEVAHWQSEGLQFELTEKLDGSSCTMYLDPDGEFHVCSRNLDLKRDENNSFWKVAIAYDVEAKLRANNGVGVAIQGELIGEGIQGNPYNIKGQDFYVYDMYDAIGGEYFPAEARRKSAETLGLKHVPVLCDDKDLGTGDVAEILLWAEDKSRLNSKTEREGIVFKCTKDPGLSFKAISNKFLLKGGEK